MKIFIIFVLCAVAVYAKFPQERDLTEEEEHRYRAECIAEIGLDPAMIDDERNAKHPTIDQRNCYVACLEKKSGNMKQDGTYDEEFILSEVPPEDREIHKRYFDELLEDCGAKVGNDSCKLAACVHGLPEINWATPNN